MQRMAIEIDQLGFDSQIFLKEKEQRFYAMKNRVINLVKAMPAGTDTDPLVQLLTNLGPIQTDTPTVEAEPRESSTHTAAEDKTAETQTKEENI